MRNILLAAGLVGTAPSVALADLDDPFTLALEGSGVRRSEESMRAGSGDIGLGARLKFFRGFGVDASYTFGAVDAPDPAQARSIKELFPAPNVRVLGIFEPLTNRYFSPYLLGGAGWATRSSMKVTTILAGAGVQIGFGPHVAIALDGYLLLPWPYYASAYARRVTEGRLAGEPVPSLGIGDFVSINRHEVQVSLRYYL